MPQVRGGIGILRIKLHTNISSSPLTPKLNVECQCKKMQTTSAKKRFNITRVSAPSLKAFLNCLQSEHIIHQCRQLTVQAQVSIIHCILYSAVHPHAMCKNVLASDPTDNWSESNCFDFRFRFQLCWSRHWHSPDTHKMLLQHIVRWWLITICWWISLTRTQMPYNFIQTFALLLENTAQRCCTSHKWMLQHFCNGHQ